MKVSQYIVYFKLVYFTIIPLLLALPACKKFVTVGTPSTLLVSKEVFSNDANANAAVAGMYSIMYQLNNTESTFAGLHLSIFSSLSADELTEPSFPQNPYLINNIPPTDPDISLMWQSCYTDIYNANAILEGLHASTGISPKAKSQYMGEAFFIRAFCHFYLTNLFGDVPLILTSDVSQTKQSEREPQQLIYKQIIRDLVQAQGLLVEDYSNSQGERVRANSWVAKAFLARVYLFTQNWEGAEAEANAIIDHRELFSLVGDLNSVFYKNSQEAIWQLESFGGDGHTQIGGLLNPKSTSTIPTYTLTQVQLNAFEAGDQRKLNWIKTYDIAGHSYSFPFKYKLSQANSGNTGEYDMVLRLAEQFLIRAEARVKQGTNIAGAISDLNTIRNRAGLPNYAGPQDSTAILAAILHERQVELFTEWGHRWLDIKRTFKANEILEPIKSRWNPLHVLYPLPSTELAKNQLLSQNAGY
jgi:hypothetical protein